jgi:alcohol dehydrogenase class IV
VQATGYIDRLLTALAPREVTLHVVPSGEPTVDAVDAAGTVVRHAGEAVVLGVGGGSALDIAKQAAVISAGSTGIEPYLLCATPLPGHRPIVAIPTTSGTGAEVTRTCIVSDRAGRKLWTWGDELLPDLVVLDPTAAATMPHAVTVGTGLDAFVHAIEACSGQRRTSIAAASAQRALALVRHNLPRVATNGADLDGRQAMQEAAFLAGIAIDNCGTGVAHSIGHAVGTLYHVPHGVAVATGLLAALRWNVEGAPDAYTRPRRWRPPSTQSRPRSPCCARSPALPRRVHVSMQTSWRRTSPRRWSPWRTSRCCTTTPDRSATEIACSSPGAPPACGTSTVHEPDRLHRDHPSSTGARSAVPCVVGPATAHQVSGHDRSGP